MEKTKPNTIKTHSPIKINVLQHKINTKKLKPGLVACLPPTASGLEMERAYSGFGTHKSVTYLHTCPLTAPDPHGAFRYTVFRKASDKLGHKAAGHFVSHIYYKNLYPVYMIQPAESLYTR